MMPSRARTKGPQKPRSSVRRGCSRRADAVAVLHVAHCINPETFVVFNRNRFSWHKYAGRQRPALLPYEIGKFSRITG
jgi:hypothetical protein